MGKVYVYVRGTKAIGKNEHRYSHQETKDLFYEETFYLKAIDNDRMGISIDFVYNGCDYKEYKTMRTLFHILIWLSVLIGMLYISYRGHKR